ncbi:hypothetical protein GDO86_014771 [Hymenochirus boettgeri]|uniref:Protein AMBP n=1 Tax=Hymenochirus boettgeri TaxID=247094 RepID=A0A8T2JYJ2_9PIPI|nr:hypothetical protein GDO86_014771 [Hymenochirus boettgeri]
MQSGWFLVVAPALFALVGCNPLHSQENIQIQENFDLPKIYGKWYDIAIGSTCKWVKLYKDKYIMGTLELSDGDSDQEIRTVSTRMRHNSCNKMVGAYQKTETPGKFNYFNPKWGVTIQNYVVFTNYDEYLIMLMRKSKNGETTNTVKLYGRTEELRPSLTEEFRQFALSQGIPEDSIFGLINNGECRRGDLSRTQRRTQRSVIPEAEMEGSGMAETPLSTNKGDSCRLAPVPGPCLGLHERYFYNTTSMACETFKFGGCLGNNNNFQSEMDCLQTCRTEAACHLPITTGPCRGNAMLWAFDVAQGKCVTFTYGGCWGNGNQFYTEKECKEYCGVSKDEEDLL